MLRAAILEGRPGTPMPPWRPFLNDAEAAWLVEQLQSGVISDAR
jgi:cytochrome c55X